MCFERTPQSALNCYIITELLTLFNLRDDTCLPMPPEPRTKLLLVDDEESIISTLKTFLELSGFEVVTAHNGVDALALIPQHRPDLVVLDVLMPHLDGRETLRQLRKQEDLDARHSVDPSGRYSAAHHGD